MLQAAWKLSESACIFSGTQQLARRLHSKITKHRDDNGLPELPLLPERQKLLRKLRVFQKLQLQQAGEQEHRGQKLVEPGGSSTKASHSSKQKAERGAVRASTTEVIAGIRSAAKSMDMERVMSLLNGLVTGPCTQPLTGDSEVRLQRRVRGVVAAAAAVAAANVARSSGKPQYAQATVQLVRQSGIAPQGSLQAAAHLVVQEYAKAGDLKGALAAANQFYNPSGRPLAPGPDNRTFVALLSAAGQAADPNALLSMWRQFAPDLTRRNGHHMPLSVISAFLHASIHCDLQNNGWSSTDVAGGTGNPNLQGSTVQGSTGQGLSKLGSGAGLSGVGTFGQSSVNADAGNWHGFSTHAGTLGVLGNTRYEYTMHGPRSTDLTNSTSSTHSTSSAYFVNSTCSTTTSSDASRTAGLSTTNGTCGPTCMTDMSGVSHTNIGASTTGVNRAHSTIRTDCTASRRYVGEGSVSTAASIGCTRSTDGKGSTSGSRNVGEFGGSTNPPFRQQSKPCDSDAHAAVRDGSDRSSVNDTVFISRRGQTLQSTSRGLPVQDQATASSASPLALSSSFTTPPPFTPSSSFTSSSFTTSSACRTSSSFTTYSLLPSSPLTSSSVISSRLPSSPWTSPSSASMAVPAQSLASPISGPSCTNSSPSVGSLGGWHQTSSAARAAASVSSVLFDADSMLADAYEQLRLALPGRKLRGPLLSADQQRSLLRRANSVADLDMLLHTTLFQEVGRTPWVAKDLSAPSLREQVQQGPSNTAMHPPSPQTPPSKGPHRPAPHPPAPQQNNFHNVRPQSPKVPLQASHAALRELGPAFPPVLPACVARVAVQQYLACGHVERAVAVAHAAASQASSDVQFWNALVAGCAQLGLVSAAKNSLYHMRSLAWQAASGTAVAALLKAEAQQAAPLGAKGRPARLLELFRRCSSVSPAAWCGLMQALWHAGDRGTLMGQALVQALMNPYPYSPLLSPSQVPLVDSARSRILAAAVTALLTAQGEVTSTQRHQILQQLFEVVGSSGVKIEHDAALAASMQALTLFDTTEAARKSGLLKHLLCSGLALGMVPGQSTMKALMKACHTLESRPGTGPLAFTAGHGFTLRGQHVDVGKVVHECIRLVQLLDKDAAASELHPSIGELLNQKKGRLPIDPLQVAADMLRELVIKDTFEYLHAFARNGPTWMLGADKCNVQDSISPTAQMKLA